MRWERGVKFGLSPFEQAWQPFVLSRLRLPDAPRILAGVITYAAAGFVSLALTIALFGRELLMALTFTRPVFWTGAPVIPVVVLAYLLHGAFLLVSIGIGIEKARALLPDDHGRRRRHEHRPRPAADSHGSG
jgi:hypothetical protein